MKKFIPIIAISAIIISFGVLVTGNIQQKDARQLKYSQPQEPSLASLVPKEEPKTSTSTTTTSTAPTKVTTPTPKPTPTTPTPTPSTPKANEYTMSQVATHNSASSCWSVVNGGVYDLTSFINQHPGGSGAIKSLCGRDGSSSFEDQHGGQRRPEQELASLKIGTLKS